MCNLYSITTNQAAIIALFRVMNRYVGNLAADARRVSRLSRARRQERRCRARNGHDALGYATATTRRRLSPSRISAIRRHRTGEAG